MSFQEYADSLRSRFRFGETSTKIIFGASIVALFAIAIGVFAAINSNSAYSNENTDIEISESLDNTIADDSNNSNSKDKTIFVHVAGSVKKPGVYELDSTSRANAAIEAAGGFTKSADKDALNLAETLIDGQQILVPSKNSCAASASSLSNSSRSSLSNTSNAKKVNINTASSEELQTLSGIGEAKAKKIIDYREQNGSFSNIDDLTRVSGIGEKTLAAIREDICV